MEQETKKKFSGLAAHHERLRLAKEQRTKEIEVEKGIKQQQIQLESMNEQAIEMALEDKPVITPSHIKELDFGIDPNKTYIFEWLEKSNTPRHNIISSSCRIFDKDGRMREIKYIPVADSIFVDEQGERYDGYPDAPLSFHRDQLMVSGKDVRLVEYLLSHDIYDGNKNRVSNRPAQFTLVNKADLERTTEERYAKIKKALNIIDDTDIKELYPVSRVVFNILDIDPTTVRNKLRKKAENNPEHILDNIESPQVKRGYVVQMALDQGIIHISEQHKSLLWFDTGVLIKEMNAIKDLKAVLTEITNFTYTVDGGKFYDIVKQKITL